MKTNETYLPLKRPSAGPFFKSTLAEIYFTIYTRGYNAVDAACLGVWIHGYAGDVLSARCTQEAYNSRDLVDYLKKGFSHLYTPAI